MLELLNRIGLLARAAAALGLVAAIGCTGGADGLPDGGALETCDVAIEHYSFHGEESAVDAYGTFTDVVLTSDGTSDGGRSFAFHAVADGSERGHLWLSDDELDGAAVPDDGDVVQLYAGFVEEDCNCTEFEVRDEQGFLWAGFEGDAETWLGGAFAKAEDVGRDACDSSGAVLVYGGLDLGADQPLESGESAVVTHQGVTTKATALQVLSAADYSTSTVAENRERHWASAVLLRMAPPQ